MSNDALDINILRIGGVAGGDVTGSGSLTSANSAVTVITNTKSNVTFALSYSAWVGAVTFEATNDVTGAAGWVSIFGYVAGTGNAYTSTDQTVIASTGTIFRTTTSAFALVRVRLSTATSGTLNVTSIASANTSGVFLNFPLPNGTNSIGYTISEGLKATFSSASIGLAVVTGATDFFCISASATKTVRVTRLEISATAATLAEVDLVLLRRSTLNTAGTAATSTADPAGNKIGHDPSNDTATATLIAYTANPTLGTIAGYLRASKLTAQAAAAAGLNPFVWDFTTRNSKGLVLTKNTTQQLCLNLNASAIVSSSFDVSIEWTEE